MDDRQVKALSVGWRAQALGQWRLVWIQYTWQSYSTIRTYHEQKRPQHAGTGRTLALLRLAVELGAHLTNERTVRLCENKHCCAVLTLAVYNQSNKAKQRCHSAGGPSAMPTAECKTSLWAEL
jgi:hypothetical protein